jgi:hypothetical protein
MQKLGLPRFEKSWLDENDTQQVLHGRFVVASIMFCKGNYHCVKNKVRVRHNRTGAKSRVQHFALLQGVNSLQCIILLCMVTSTEYPFTHSTRFTTPLVCKGGR